MCKYFVHTVFIEEYDLFCSCSLAANYLTVNNEKLLYRKIRMISLLY